MNKLGMDNINIWIKRRVLTLAVVVNSSENNKYYWYGQSNAVVFKAVAPGIHDRLISSVSKVSSVNVNQG